MRHQHNLGLAPRLMWRAALALALGVGIFATSAEAAYTTGNLVVDPSFENNPLIPFVLILGPPFTSGAWGAESATISGTSDGITPASGSLMLNMTDDGLVATQAFQFVDVTAYTADINAGIVSVDASALYNVPAAITAGVSSVNVGFYDASHSLLGNIATSSNTLGGGFVDSNVNTWQALNVVAAPLPFGTQYILMQAAYGNASMIDQSGLPRSGYVDDARLSLTAVPEPSTIVLAGLGLLGALAMRKRR